MEKMKQLNHDQMELARKDIETTEQKEEADELAGMEGAFDKMDTPGSTQNIGAVPTPSPTKPAAKHSGLKWGLIALGVLLVLAAGALYALTKM
jgi:hypothetical protein